MTSSDAAGAAGPHRFPLLDPLRALAAISVLLVHTAIFTGAFDDRYYGRFLAHLDIGVPFFFLLSAFLLYRPFVEARVTGTPRTRFSDYGKRRFVRIFPAYWAVLTLAAIVPGMAGAFSGNWWVYYGLLQNYPVYEATGTCAVDPFRCGIPIAWTLSIEVFFYLTLPLFVLAMAWLGERWHGGWLRLELAAVALISAISIVIQSSVPMDDVHTWLFFSPLGRGWWFGLGLALAAISVEVSHRPTEPAFIDWVRRHPGVPVLGGALLYALGRHLLVRALPVALLSSRRSRALRRAVPAGRCHRGAGDPPRRLRRRRRRLWRRTLRHRSLVWLGLVSYGIFLWQFPVLIFLLDADVDGFLPLTVLTFTLTVGCAALSYYLLERPLMRRVRRRTAVAEPAAG